MYFFFLLTAAASMDAVELAPAVGFALEDNVVVVVAAVAGAADGC